MRKVLALVRAQALAEASYRVAFLSSIATTALTAVPVFFVTRALQPTMAASIADQGRTYFGFVMLGLLASQWMQFGATALSGALLGAVRSGTLEAVLATPTRLPTLLAGLVAWPACWALLRTGAMLGAAAVLGADVRWTALPAALAVLALLTLAYASVSLVSSALVLTVRTSGLLDRAVLFASYLLGGVYYPTTVIPGWLRDLAEIVPLAPALRALRRLLLDGGGADTVLADVGRLALLAAALLAVTVPLLLAALHSARRSGTLAQP